ncbi:YhcN/YlaJ family sporulation lipoprotein [Evansella sp. AB-rgal1]|uniref:YhcN/YlaJ family sporulation lipoprotein n=1 Tax=Evansella sp. AB-rgal1 TaxID=3242696 RepID=UPI00359CF56C
MKKQLQILLLVAITLVGCQDIGSPQNAYIYSVESNSQPVVSQQLAERIKHNIEEMNEVDEVYAISYEKDVYIALSVSGFNRLFLKQIREDAKKRAKEIDGEITIYISTDRKVEMEISDLERKVRGNMKKEKLEKEINKIQDHM